MLSSSVQNLIHMKIWELCRAKDNYIGKHQFPLFKLLMCHLNAALYIDIVITENAF